jgi:putative protease
LCSQYMNSPELLMPAGDLEKAKIAYQFGADACYGSTPAFSMRTREVGFTIATLKKAIEYAHDIGKKFYVTVNIFPHENELTAIKHHTKKIISMKPDAIIVADLGVLKIATEELRNRKTEEKIEIHLSTQANATNSETIKQYSKLGIKRIILPREISIDNIKRIRKVLPKKIELEAFVHGAMCMSISGRCHLSNYLTGRDANHGQCVQSCRWNYALLEEKRPDKYLPIEEDMNYSYIFNARDLCMIEHLNKLRDAGILSLKVEGRNKSIYYCAIVARAYRKAIDSPCRSELDSESSNATMKQLIHELLTVTSRGYSTGFYFGKPSNKDTNYKTSRPHSDWQFVGIISSVIPSKTEGSFRYIVDVRNEIKPGIRVEIVTPDEIYKMKIDKLTTPDGKTLPKANPNNEITLECNNDLPANSFLRTYNQP